MRSRLLITCCVGLLLLSGVPAMIHAEVPNQINYQGYLTDSDGNPVPDNNYGMLFTIYDSSTGTIGLWDEFQTVTVTKGIYNVHVGSVDPIGNPFPENLFDGQRWLGVTVEGDPEMEPRQL